MKVKFKQEILDLIREKCIEDWDIVYTNGSTLSYTNRFDQPYFIVDTYQYNSVLYRDVSILEPGGMDCYYLDKDHIIPYGDDALISIDDSVFD